MIKIIDRYVLHELVEPFLFGLGAFTSILTASMVMFELVRAVVLKGMPLIVALQLFIYRLPSVVVYIFPMATLLAVLLAFSRLNNDSEIIAFRSGGVSLYRLMMPVLFFGLLISFINLTFSEIVMPRANLAAKNLLVETSAKYTPKIQQNIFVPEMDHGKLKRIFYASQMEGNKMSGVIVQEFTDNRLSQIISADSARWEPEKNSWVFTDGIIHLLSPDGEYKHVIKFNQQRIAIKYSPADLLIGEKNPEDMNIRELGKFIKLKQRMGEEVTDFKIQLNMKLAIPFACLVFALLGAPLGLSPRRASSSIGLGLSIIIIFLYYIITFISMALGELHWLTPSISAWLPNIITAGVGWYILSKAAMR